MLEVKHLHKYHGYHHILNDINLKLPVCGLIGITGASGSGKTTLLHILAGIDRDYEGDLMIDGQKVSSLPSIKRTTIVFQRFHLIHYLNGRNNIDLYDYFHHRSGLTSIGQCGDFLATPVAQLSLGQRQLLSFERACHPMPEILLADEPTASLDRSRAHQMMVQLKHWSQQALVIIVSHDRGLLDQYCDGLYELEDGRMISSSVECHQHQPVEAHLIKSHRSLLALSIGYLKSTRYTLPMIASLTLSLLCVMLTLTLSLTFQKAINDTIDAMIPGAMISFKVHEQDDPSQLDFKHVKNIKNVFIYVDHVELLGLSHHSRYQSQEALAISDESDTVNEVTYGRLMAGDDEIVLPLSTAKRLTKDVAQLINSPIYIHYKYRRKVKSVKVTIVGIAPGVLNYTAFYQYQSAQWVHAQSLFGSLRSSYGVIHYRGDGRKVLRSLEKHYPDYEFKIVGESTHSRVDHLIDQITLVLIIFSLLSVFASICLLIELSLLSVDAQALDYSIMMCFGAKKRHLIAQILFQNTLVYLLSLLVSLVYYGGIMILLSQVVMPMVLDVSVTITWPYDRLVIIALLTYIGVMSTSLMGLVKVLKMNPSEVLKAS